MKDVVPISDFQLFKSIEIFRGGTDGMRTNLGPVGARLTFPSCTYNPRSHISSTWYVGSDGCNKTTILNIDCKYTTLLFQTFDIRKSTLFEVLSVEFETFE